MYLGQVKIKNVSRLRLLPFLGAASFYYYYLLFGHVGANKNPQALHSQRELDQLSYTCGTGACFQDMSDIEILFSV